MRRLLTPGWLVVHALALLAVVSMLGLAFWQYSRAQGGNAISWGYLFQWPAFAAFAAFVWWREVQRALRGEPEAQPEPIRAQPDPLPAPDAQTPDQPSRRRPVVTRRRVPVPAGEDDPQLAAYNRYLAWLRANPGARPSDYPG